ncbi:MAG: esterase, partial [Halieaceae bacterium]
MSQQYHHDKRLDPRCVPILENLRKTAPKNLDVASREELIAITSTPAALEREEQTHALMDLMDNERIASRDGLRIETHDIRSAPDGNTIKLQSFRPDTDETLPCVYYMHGGGMMTASCFRGCYQTWARLLAHQNLCVVMVDFRNALRPSSAPEVEPFPA